MLYNGKHGMHYACVSCGKRTKSWADELAACEEWNELNQVADAET